MAGVIEPHAEASGLPFLSEVGEALRKKERRLSGRR